VSLRTEAKYTLVAVAATFFTIERRRIPVETSGTSGVARWLATHGSFGDFPAKLPWSCARNTQQFRFVRTILSLALIIKLK
jgi:hypothetical protein